MDTITQVHTNADSMGDNGGEQFASNGIVKGVDFGPAYSSPISQAKDCLAVSPGVNKFQVLRNLMENYPCSNCDSYFCDQAVSSLVVPEFSFEVHQSIILLKRVQGVDYLHSEEKNDSMVSRGS